MAWIDIKDIESYSTENTLLKMVDKYLQYLH